MNELEFNDVKIQIVKNSLEGYYIKFEDGIIPINKRGELIEWPKGLFDMQLTQLRILIEIRRNKLKSENKNMDHDE